jgi:hypothetical protein
MKRFTVVIIALLFSFLSANMLFAGTVYGDSPAMLNCIDF